MSGADQGSGKASKNLRRRLEFFLFRLVGSAVLRSVSQASSMSRARVSTCSRLKVRLTRARMIVTFYASGRERTCTLAPHSEA